MIRPDYFALPTEPGLTGWIAVVLAGALGLLLARRLPSGFVPLAWALALVAAGAGLAGLRAWVVAAPVLEFRYYGPIKGRIVEIDRATSDALRLTLDRVVLDGLDPARTPERVRISLRDDQRWLVAEPGRVVMLTGHLASPSCPVEPGDFDFRRAAWFERLGAVGYTHSPVLTRAPPQGGLWPHQLRMRLSDGIKARIDEDAVASPRRWRRATAPGCRPRLTKPCATRASITWSRSRGRIWGFWWPSSSGLCGRPWPWCRRWRCG